ncbi:S-formylglutathione hydrolase FrmB [Marmoricola sp. OAE513]|uniref:alpha/beta hydrolase n=1 Tax=Marmoricola sp. OAE513 TaxID=2817894 RepID=UPI001AE7D7EF
MKRAFLAVLVLGLLAVPSLVSAQPAATGPAGTASAIRVVSEQRESARVTKFKVTTPSLAMSAKVPLRINVVLPTDYAAHPKRRYPVLYALPGTSNLADVWLTNLDTVNLTKALPVIVVVPDGTYDADGGGFYTNWADRRTSRGVADWETFHTAELVRWVDQRYRTIPNRTGRAILGISQGGFGSMSYAARHPDLYGAAASFSGATAIYDNPVCRLGASVLIAGIMVGLNGVQPFAPFGDPLGNAANWKARDPASNVAKLSGTYVEIYTSSGLPGKDDLTDPAVVGTVALETVLHASNLCFKQAADRAGVKIGWHDYPYGTHAWMYGDRSLKDYLPRLMAFFRDARS